MKEQLLVFWAVRGPLILIASTLMALFLILALRPALKRYAVARPNERSSHKIPTPQSGGVAVVATVIVVSYAAFYFLPLGAAAGLRFPVIYGAILLIAGVGLIADIHSEKVVARLLLQAFAVTAVIFALPSETRALPILPLPIERVILVIGCLWFVNLVNFMDGLDWMTVAEVVPLTAALAVIGLFGLLPPAAVIVSLALCGAMIGFAFFNRPVAKLFLGDVGSLPIGLLLAWLLILLAGNGGRAAAILLPLYYLADSTVTLARRAQNGEKVWQAHRSHFYQRATDRGFSVLEVVARVFAVNIVLAMLAVATAMARSRVADFVALIVGLGVVIALLHAFARGRGRK